MRDLEAYVCTDAPDPKDAAIRLQRILSAAQHDEIVLHPLGDQARVVLRLACQRAPYLASLLARDPERLLRVGSDPHLRRAKSRKQFARELQARVGGITERDQFDKTLRVYRGDEMVRIGVRELELGIPLEVGEELSFLADQCLNAAITFHERALVEQIGKPYYVDLDNQRHTPKLAVIAMGKLGGLELNFCSDVDLIFVYSSDEGSAGEMSLHEFFSELCRRTTSSIGDVTEDGAVFRVDLRLRPEGSQGPIANSLDSMESYYEAYGRPWERQAWIKARACAGSLKLGNELLAILKPFIHPRHTAPTILDEVRSLNQRIKKELTGGLVDTGFDLKNGKGGIREIEFFVQGLQLIHAGKRPRLQVRSTMAALDELLFAGLISEDERHHLASAYRFLRRLEHMVQLESGRQTQRLPTEPQGLQRLARRTGYENEDQLVHDLEKHTNTVSESFDTLGEPPVGPPPTILRLLRETGSRQDETQLLAELGFRNPTTAWANLDRARRKELSPLARAAQGTAAFVAPHLLAEIATSPDPDLALLHLSGLISRRGSWSAIWGMMADNPELLRLVASLFGTSEYLSKTFIQHPELLDALLSAGLAKAKYTTEELDLLVTKQRAEAKPHQEEQWNAIAEFKNTQVLRVGLADIAGTLNAEAVCHQLSRLAVVCVRHALDVILAELTERHGVVRNASGKKIELAIFAMGKLGGSELGYASDLDVVFVYDGDGEGQSDGAVALDTPTYMSRVTQRLMSGLHILHPAGRLYEVDTRLRPNGSQGVLVSSLKGWRQYHEQTIQIWERQALTKLRWIAGSEEVGRQVVSAARACVYRDDADPVEIAQAVAAMRQRICTELVAPGRTDMKAGRGGIVDVEFAAQYLQLVHGARHPELQTTSTTTALEAAATLSLASPALCRLLADGYRFLRRIEHRLRIVHDRSEHHLPTDPTELEKLARRAGYPTGEQLNEAFSCWAKDLREAYTKLLGIAE